MSRWEVRQRTNEHDQPKPEKIELTWIVGPTSLCYGPAFIAEFPNTPEGRAMADEVVQYLNAEYVAGMRDNQQAVQHALGLLDD